MEKEQSKGNVWPCHGNYSILCFVHPIFRFWFLVTFGNKVTKILRNLCLQFARQDGQNRKKKRKENHATKVTKRQKYGMNETLICRKGHLTSYLSS